MKERLLKIRKELGLTQTEFANTIQIAQSSVVSYETGKRIPSDSVINNICKTFDVNEKWLRDGEGEMFVKITMDEEIANFLVRVQTKDDDSYMKKYILALSKLSEEEWSLLEKIHALGI